MTIQQLEKTITRPLTLDDVQALTDLLNAESQAAIGVDETKADELRNDFQAPGFDMTTDTCGVFDEAGRLIASGILWNRNAPYVRSWLNFAVHPDHLENPELAQTVLDWAQEAARAKIGKAPENARITMSSGGLSVEEVKKSHLEAAGFASDRYFFMMQIDMDAPPPQPVLPEGLTIRTMADVDNLHAVMMAVDAAFQDHWGYTEPDFEQELKDWEHWIDSLKQQGDYDPALWFFVMDGDQIAGMSLCTPRMTEDPDKAYVDTLGVLRPWRRRGLGLALLHHTFGEFYRRGTKKVALHVDGLSLTGATRLYEKSGMHIARRYDGYEKVLRDGEELRTVKLDG